MDAIDRLLAIMARLRAPDGCPWDREQTFATVQPYTIEEAYEVAAAIEDGDLAALREELGDLLFQVVFHARMAEELGAFTFADVATTIADKMERRHPHVFGNARITSAAAQTTAWEAHKESERTRRARVEGRPTSTLDGIPRTLPALSRALKLQRRAARVGFDWAAPEPVLDKVHEEVRELRQALAEDASKAAIESELGDLLFAVTNLARHLDIDPESAARTANAKFERRFRALEQALAESGRTPRDTNLDEMEALWQAVKAQEPPA